MSEPATDGATALKIVEDNCSNCYICSYLCPYEAIKRDTETEKVLLEIEKCQVCGLCYSTCPAKAIDVIYYDVDSFTRYLEKAKQDYKCDTLVIACKGSSPDLAGVEKLLGVREFIPLSVPCVGRIPDEVLLKAIVMGINKIHILACDEDYCRFERGSSVTGRKIWALNTILKQLGYGKEVITFKRNSLKVIVDTDSCIMCGNCVFYCPYDAASLGSPGVVNFDLNACRGCGLCVAMCPAQALELENWEEERISTTISNLSLEMTSPKIMVFRCQWAVYPSLNGNPLPNVRFIDLPCASRVDILHILEALRKGADGILIAACAEEDCKQEKSSGKAQRSVEKLIQRLAQIGLQDKLHFCIVAPRHPEKFNEELEQFSKKVEAIVSKNN